MTSITARRPAPTPLTTFSRPTSTSTTMTLINGDGNTPTNTNGNEPTNGGQNTNNNDNDNTLKRQTSPSPSDSSRSRSRPPSMSLGSKISALGARIGRTLSHSGNGNGNNGGEGTTEREGSREKGTTYETLAGPGAGATGFYGYGYVYAGEDGDSVSEILYRKERSTSRGRDAFQSTGRGGLGNIRAASASRDRPTTGPDDFSVTRGREPVAHHDASPQIFSTGRGGAGNLRSPSRQPKDATLVEEEQEVIREYVASQEHAVHSSGRGGIGNMNRSRSRDPTSPSVVAAAHSHSPAGGPRFSTGRGGAGNILPEGHTGGEQIAADEEERKRVLETGGPGGVGIHSTGRGGTANLTSAHEPPVEHHPHHHHHPHGEHDHTHESTGRGGAGNIREIL